MEPPWMMSPECREKRRLTEVVGIVDVPQGQQNRIHVVDVELLPVALGDLCPGNALAAQVRNPQPDLSRS